MPQYNFTHSLTHSRLTHSHSLTHSLARLTHSLTHSLELTHTHSLTHSLARSHSLTHAVEPKHKDNMLTSKFPGAPQTLRPSLQPLSSPAPVEDMQRGSLKPSKVFRNRPKMTRFSCIESKGPLCYAPDDIRRAALVYMSKSVAF
jgi:hypothetical protein